LVWAIAGSKFPAIGKICLAVFLLIAGILPSQLHRRLLNDTVRSLSSK
jgi:hypothetical protein